MDEFIFASRTVVPNTYTFGIAIDDGVNPPYSDNSCCSITVLPPDPTLDSDGDGVGDYVDNCPYAFNPLQEDNGGFQTLTPDGIGDACQCGDMDGSGMVDFNDLVQLANALTFATGASFVNVVRPELCNITGNPACQEDDAYLFFDYILTSNGQLPGGPTPPLPALCEPAVP